MLEFAVRKGVGSNPTLVMISFFVNLVSFLHSYRSLVVIFLVFLIALDLLITMDHKKRNVGRV